MVTINQSAINKKGQRGTITAIITKSTGYVEFTLENGKVTKEMAFNLVDENGVSLKSAPKKQAPKPISQFDQTLNKFQWINGQVYGGRNSMSYRISEEIYATVEMKARESGNDFIQSVCQSVIKYMKCSDKQAYCLAKFAIENNLSL